jgi:DNA-directed RNA polymerase specialized sigma24 family protein
VSPGYDGLFEKWELRIAGRLIWKFQHKWPCLRREQRDDLTQECLSHWHFIRNQYNPNGEASREAFMVRVVRNKLVDLVRERTSNKRKTAYFTVSLDLLIESEAGHLSVSSGFPTASLADPASDPYSLLELKIDLSRTISKLTSQQGEICHLLRQFDFCVQAVSDYLNLAPRILRKEIKRIRAIFEAERLQEYLG